MLSGILASNAFYEWRTPHEYPSFNLLCAAKRDDIISSKDCEDNWLNVKTTLWYFEDKLFNNKVII